MYSLYIWYMKTTTDKRLTFKNDDIKVIAIAAAMKGKSAKVFMEESVLSAAIMILSKGKRK